MSEKLSPGAQARAARDAEFAARFGSGAQSKAVVPKADPAAPARSRAVAIRAGLTSWAETRRLIMEARQAEDWIALGYASFELYCDGEFSMKSLRLTAQERDDAIIAFRSAGMTFREIGAATGTSKNTAQRALKAAEVDHRVPDGTKLPQVEALRQAIEDATVSKDSFACEVCGKKLAAGIVRAAQTRCLKCDPNRDHFSTEVGGPCLACPTETSGAVPPASTEDASPVLGEPDVDEQAASTSGTQSAAGPEVEVAPSPADEAAVPAAVSAGRAGGQTPARPVPTDSPAADSLPPQAHAGVPAVGGPIEERTEEKSGPWDVVWTSVGNDAEIDRQTFDSYQLALAEMERSRRAGSIAEVDIEPTPTDSPTGLEAAQPRDDRSETDDDLLRRINEEFADSLDAAVYGHHAPAGVSGVGEAPEVASTDPVEPVELEGGGTAQDPPSSSDPDALMTAFAALVHYLSQLDADALGPLLHEDDMPTLFDHIETFEVFVRRLGKARFTEMTRTP